MSELPPQTNQPSRAELAARAREAAARISRNPTQAADITGGEKKDNIFKRGLGKLRDASSEAGNLAGGVGHAAGEAAGAIGRTTGNILGGAGHLPLEGTRRAAGVVVGGAELSKAAAEALVNKMGQALEDRRVFGKSVADFALHGAATRGLSMGSRELAKGIVSYSGLAGAIGGGVTGTVVAGAFVGAMSGALVEYARQVNRNIDREAAADPSVAGRRAAFLLKFKELRHTEVLKPTDLKKIRNAAIFGMLAGTGASALMEHTQIGELIRDRFSGNVPGLEGIKNIASGTKDMVGGVFGGAGNLAGGAKDLGGGVWHGAGELAGNAKDWAGTAPGVEGVKGIAGGAKDLAGNIPGVQGAENLAGNAKDMAGNIPGIHGIGDLAGGAGEMARNIPGVSGAGDIAGGIGHGMGEAAGAVGQTGGNILGGVSEMAGNIPGVHGVGDAVGGVWHGAGEIVDNTKHAVGLGDVHEAGQQAAAEAGHQAAGEAVQAPEGFVPRTDYDALNQQLADANKTIADLRQLAEANQAAGGVHEAAGAAGAVAQTAAEQASAQASAVLESLGSSIPLETGSNPWEVSQDILKSMGVDHPNPDQIMQLDKVLCQENDIAVPAWGITGIHDAHNLQPFDPIKNTGIKFNLTDTVKKTALAIATKK